MKTRNFFFPLIISALAGYGSMLSAQQSVGAEGNIDMQGNVEVNKNSVAAREDAELDITLTVVGEDEDVNDVIEPIALPEMASQVGIEHSASGIATANIAREDGREAGRTTAEAARERGAETAEKVRTQTRETVKDNIPEGTLHNLPEDIRDNIPENVRSRLQLDNTLDSTVDITH